MKMKTLGSSRLRVNVTVNAAYFYVGTSGAPSAAGATRLRDERGGSSPLRKYRGEGINFGDVRIPAGVEFPKPARVGALRGVHGVSSDAVVVVDAQTLLFWVGRGAKPSPAGVRIPDENGKEAPLRKYDRKTIVLTLPGELTVFDIGHFGVWCEAFTVDFGHVALPREQLANIPPSLKMLGVSPQKRGVAREQLFNIPNSLKMLGVSRSYIITIIGVFTVVSAAWHCRVLSLSASFVAEPQQSPRGLPRRCTPALPAPADRPARRYHVPAGEARRRAPRRPPGPASRPRRAPAPKSRRLPPPHQQLIPTPAPKQPDSDYERLQEQQRRNQQQLQLLQQQLYQQQQQQKLLEQQTYQQRLYEQQLYEERALRQRDPERFQLVPYQGEIAQRFADRQREELYQAQRRISQPEQYRPEERLSAQRYQELNAQ
ncbi:hypothetical protein MSG28_014033, partial [Choristoneura fumiferana]